MKPELFAPNFSDWDSLAWFSVFRCILSPFSLLCFFSFPWSFLRFFFFWNRSKLWFMRRAKMTTTTHVARIHLRPLTFSLCALCAEQKCAKSRHHNVHAFDANAAARTASVSRCWALIATTFGMWTPVRFITIAVCGATRVTWITWIRVDYNFLVWPVLPMFPVLSVTPFTVFFVSEKLMKHQMLRENPCRCFTLLLNGPSVFPNILRGADGRIDVWPHYVRPKFDLNKLSTRDGPLPEWSSTN